MASSIINSDDGSVSGITGLKTTGGDDGELAFESSGTERMRIDSSGNVLVGTSSAFGSGTYGLRVSNTATDGFGSISLQGNRTVSEDTAGLLQVFNSTTEITRLSTVLGANATSGVLSFQTASTGTLAERMRIDSSGNLKFDSGYGSVATAYGCRAWVNFNGTGTVAIRGSGNVSSITDNGVGSYRVNFTSAMPDGNYCVTAWANNYMTATGYTGITLATTYINAIQVQDSSGNAADAQYVGVAVFR